MTKLLALDPGGSTGWATFLLGPTTPLRRLNYGTITGGLHGFLRWWHEAGEHEDCEVVVAEDFILDGRTAMPDLTPRDILGALEAFGWTADWHLVRQRNVMKAHAPDELLKTKGLWIPGAGHDRDAERHAIAWAKTTRHMPTLKWLYGKESG